MESNEPPPGNLRVPRLLCRLKTKLKLFGLLGPHFATIAKFRWFSKAPSPLNGMVWGNHWFRWFFDGFGVRQPLVSMVFDGCPPLVRRWNGNIPSLKSSCHPEKKNCLCPSIFTKVHNKYLIIGKIAKCDYTE